MMSVLKNNAIQYNNKSIKNRKTNFVRKQLQRNTKKPKELLKVLKNIGSPSKATPISKMS